MENSEHISSDEDWKDSRTVPQWNSSRAERSEEHTSELQSRGQLVCRLPLEKKISPIDELSSIALGFGMLNTSHRRHTRRPAISPKMEWRRRDRSPRLPACADRAPDRTNPGS